MLALRHTAVRLAASTAASAGRLLSTATTEHYGGVISDTDPRGITRLMLNRPNVHNAFDEEMMAALTEELKRLERAPQCKVVVLSGAGKSFSAGADLNYMNRMSAMSRDENKADSQRLAELMRTLNFLKKPTIALVQGTAFGGGVGLVACCDIAIATKTAKFCFSEVKLGLIPAVISPYCYAAMGERAARRYFISAEVFSGVTARETGLVHEVVETEEELQSRGTAIATGLLDNGPGAMAAAKELMHRIRAEPITAELIADTAHRIAGQRHGEEARERIGAFLAKSKAGKK